MGIQSYNRPFLLRGHESLIPVHVLRDVPGTKTISGGTHSEIPALYPCRTRLPQATETSVRPGAFSQGLEDPTGPVWGGFGVRTESLGSP